MRELFRRGWRRSQVLRFAITGAFNTGLGYGIYAGLVFFGLGYALANLLALVIGILVSFKTQGRFVFDNRSNRLLGRFIASWVIIYLLTVALIGRLIAYGFDAYIAGALAVPFSTILSFLAQKYLVFQRPRAASHETMISKEKACHCDSV